MFELFGDTEVSNFESFVFGYENVATLNVSVDDVLLMNKVKCLTNLNEPLEDQIFFDKLVFICLCFDELR